MRDAYVFLWKRTPSTSRAAHDDPAHAINLFLSPVILQQPGFYDRFPGRRPGMIVLGVKADAGARTVPFKVVSLHAATPCNAI